MNTIKKLGLAGIGTCVLSLCMATQAWGQQEGLGERLGERIDRGLDRLGETVQEGWDSLRNAVNRMGVQGRVYARLRWDKGVATQEIDVDVDEEGRVVLRGTLKTAESKRKALELAKETVGVRVVVDDLSVEKGTGVISGNDSPER